METSQIGVVQAQNYSNKVEILQDSLLRFSRDHDWQPGSQQIDTFGRYWSLALIDADKYQIIVNRNNEQILLSGGQALFFPPFSLVEWHINSPKLKWVGYFSDTSLDFLGFNEPVSFKWDKLSTPNNVEDIQSLLRTASKMRLIGLGGKDFLARKVKALIDTTYRDAMTMEGLANQVGTVPEVLIRRFKNNFHLSPVQYRNRLRLTESIVRLMTSNTSVGQIALELGFNDVSFFNKVFKRELNATPSDFRL